MKPLGEYFINHCDVRRDAEPHMYLDNVRSAVVAAMRAGQCVAAVLRLRVDDHVVRRVMRPPLTPPLRGGGNGGGGAERSALSPPLTPRRGVNGGRAEITFSGSNLRDVLTKAPVFVAEEHEIVLRPCMHEIIDWVYANGLTWFLATHSSERNVRNVFSAAAVPAVLLAPTQYMLCVHWYPESFAMATVAKSLHKFWIARTMPVPFEPAAVTRMHTTILQAMTMGAMHCTLLLLQRDGDFSECGYGDSRTATHVCIDPRRTLDMKPLVEQQILIAYYVNAERHGALLRWLTVDQGLGWFLALPAEDAPWAYFVATWERVGFCGATE